MSLSIGPVLVPSLTESLGNTSRANTLNGPVEKSKSDSPSAVAVDAAASPAGPDGAGQVVQTPQVVNEPNRQPAREDPFVEKQQSEDIVVASQQTQSNTINEAVTDSIDGLLQDKVNQAKTTSLNDQSEPIEFTTSRLGIDLNQHQPSAKQKGISESGFQSSIHVPDWLKGVTIDDLISQLRDNPAENQQEYTEQRADLTGDPSALSGRQLDTLA